MGPGAGTAMLYGVGMGFANVVSRGPVGVVAAAGTGAQEVTCAHRPLRSGVSECYGTGGHDLHAEIGAISALSAIDRLAPTRRPWSSSASRSLPTRTWPRSCCRALAATGKPAVACMVGGGDIDVPVGVTLAPTLEAAAIAAARLAGRDVAEPPTPEVEWVLPGRVRGLFSGGTLCSEAAAILAERLGGVAVECPGGIRHPARCRRGAHRPRRDRHGRGGVHPGSPHPMIDPQPRVERLAREAADHSVAVILLDVVLGYASHPDPAAFLAPAVAAALAARPNLAVVAHVCGTEADPQVLSRQEAALAAAGARLCSTNAQAARLAAALVG